MKSIFRGHHQWNNLQFCNHYISENGDSYLTHLEVHVYVKVLYYAGLIGLITFYVTCLT